MLINSLNHNDFLENHQRSQGYIHALEEERGKIQVFQRELPLCLELVTQAIAACKQRLSGTESNYNLTVQFSCSEQTSSELPVLEEFIPLKRVSSDSDGKEEDSQKPKNDINSKKSDWLRSVQLWNQTPDSPAKLEVKKNRSTGTFHPFKKEKSCDAMAPTASARVPPASASSTAETSRGDGKKKGEKEGHSQTKPRRSWSPELHRRFLQALKQLGGPDVATPKQIREFMKVDGLTNDEVKSHLQKYRLHIRRPSLSFRSTTINPPQYVVVGGIWVSPEYAKMATTAEASGGATSTGAYAPRASLSQPFRETSASPKQRNHTEALDFNNKGRPDEGHVQSQSLVTTSSIGTTTASPEY
ncbi:transcription factor HHO3-like [Primulina eburnea]|uniref:transcription factor HHO3-like n=1 Tax=Primulina eburnea TaxID=1245227 RepID=UPI003C6CB5F1